MSYQPRVLLITRSSALISLEEKKVYVIYLSRNIDSELKFLLPIACDSSQLKIVVFAPKSSVNLISKGNNLMFKNYLRKVSLHILSIFFYFPSF